MIELGKKIRYFRKRGGLSQFKLEDLIGASAGSLSRIENGEVNPTKETMGKIISTLKLTYIETLFLNGDYAEPIDLTSAQTAIESIYTLLNNPKIFAYVVDERFRLWGVSLGFKKVFNLPMEPIVQNGSRNVLEMLFLEDSIISKNFVPKTKLKICTYQLARAKQIFSLFEIDEYLLNLYRKVSKSLLFKKAWEEVNTRNFDIYLAESRTVTLKFGNKIFVMEYQREPLTSNPRLFLVIYKPTNLLLKFALQHS